MPHSQDSSLSIDAVWQSVLALPPASQMELANRILAAQSNRSPSLEARRGIVESLSGCLKQWSHFSDEDVRELIADEILKKHSP